MNLWTSEEIQQATNGTLQGDAFVADGVSIDSRTIKQGDIFIALQGENFDGHKYVQKALENGAVAAIVSNAENLQGNLIIVNDTEKALCAIGVYRRKQLDAKVVAVTGSVGKTSTKEMACAALSKLGKSYATEGNLNNHLGVPLSLSRITKDTKFCVLELGMSSAGEIVYLVDMINPDVAIITNIEAVHMEFFGSLHDIADAKGEIFENVKAGGTAIINRDNDYCDYLIKTAQEQEINNIVTIGEAEKADYRLLSYDDGNVVMTAKGTEYKYKLGLEGKHQALNSLNIVAALDSFGVDVSKGLEGLAEIQAGSGRGQLLDLDINGKKITVVNDCYNASSASIKASLANVKSMKAKRKIAILGDMLELGADSAKFHAELSSAVNDSGVDKLYTVGGEMKNLYNAVSDDIKGASYQQSEEVNITDIIEDGDLVLLKGSNGMKLRLIVEELQKINENKVVV